MRRRQGAPSGPLAARAAVVARVRIPGRPPVLLLLVLALRPAALATTAGPAAATTVVVTSEGSAALLPCSIEPPENLKSKLFDWKMDGRRVLLYDGESVYNNGDSEQDPQFSGRVFHFEDQLQHGNASIVLRDARVSDSGNYTCIFPRFLQQDLRFSVRLIVHAVSKPHIQILDAVDGGVPLKCDVHNAFPQPEVELQDSDGNVLPSDPPLVTRRDDRHNVSVTAIATETPSRRFFCVARQQEVMHEVRAEVYVPEKMFQQPSSGVTGGVVGFLVGGVVGGLAVIAVQKVNVRRNRSRDRPQRDAAELSPAELPLALPLALPPAEE